MTSLVTPSPNITQLLAECTPPILLDLNKHPPVHVAALWHGAGAASRVFAQANMSYIVKVIKSNAELTPVQIDSYRVEQAFYNQGFANTCLEAAQVTVPVCRLCGELQVESSTSSSHHKSSKSKKKTSKATNKRKHQKKNTTEQESCPILGVGPRFYSVLTDLTQTLPVQVEDCNLAQARAALSWMAKVHAQFTGKVDSSSNNSNNSDNSDNGARNYNKTLRGLWSSGTYWTLNRKRDMVTNMDRIYDQEVQRRLKKEHDDSTLTPSVLALGQRLKQAAEAIHHRLQPSHRLNQSSWFTLVHGDLKGANIAFSGMGDGTGGGGGTCTAGVFDFQWSGGGLGCQDVAYFMIAAVDPAVLELEEELLRGYYVERKALIRVAKQHKKHPLMTFEEFKGLYEMALLDFMRWLVSYGLWGGPCEAWSLKKVDEILSKIDGGSVGQEKVYVDALK